MPDPTTRRRFVYALGAATTVGFVGHGAADDHGPGDERDDHGDHEEHGHDEEHDHDEDPDGEFNDADVEFMRMMIPHHVQAIEMAELVPGRTDRRELCDLAPEIIDVQEEEIEQMHDWLADAGVDHEHADHAHEEMEGMLSEEEMDELRRTDGREFDCRFVEGMIHHHEGAIEMAENVLEDGRADRVLKLADEVIDVQEAEIDEMEDWRADWGC